MIALFQPLLLTMVFPMKEVVLTLSGNLEEGFNCDLSISGRAGSLPIRKGGSLPQNPELYQNYRQWLMAYEHQIGVVRKAVVRGPRLNSEEVEANIPDERAAWQTLVTSLNNWLDSQSFLDLQKKLLAGIGDEEVKFIIQTESKDLLRLPWREWTALDSRKAEFAFCRRDIDPVEVQGLVSQSKKIRILVILGDDDKINTQADCAIIEHLPGVEISVLNQPTLKEVCDSFKEGFDISLFSGHSFSKGDSGLLKLNSENTVGITNFKNALYKATQKGLKLAIFNSCESLSFGRELAQIVPRTILMKESIPDDFAQDFLRHFFKYFVDGDSFIVAVRKTREELEHYDAHYPSVTSIPVIIQAHPEEPPLFWSDLVRDDKKSSIRPVPPDPTVRILKRAALLMLGAVALLGGSLWAVRNFSSNPSTTPSPQAMSSPNTTSTSNAQIPESLLPLPKTVAEVKFPDDFKYGGSTSFKDALKKVGEAISSSSGVRSIYTSPEGGREPGSNWGISQLQRPGGSLDVAVSSRPLQNAEETATLQAVPVAVDGIGIVVHPDVQVPGLTLEQLAKIYTGQVTDWGEVGGQRGLKITPISRNDEAGGTVDQFVEKVMPGQRMRDVVPVRNTTAGLQKVEQTSGAIFFATASEVVPKCKVKPIGIGLTSTKFVSPHTGSLVPPSECPTRLNQVNTEAFTEGRYPLTRLLFVVIKRDGGKREQVGKAYAQAFLSNEGQQILSESGFGKIRK